MDTFNSRPDKTCKDTALALFSGNSDAANHQMMLYEPSVYYCENPAVNRLLDEIGAKWDELGELLRPIREEWEEFDS